MPEGKKAEKNGKNWPQLTAICGGPLTWAGKIGIASSRLFLHLKHLAETFQTNLGSVIKQGREKVWLLYSKPERHSPELYLSIHSSSFRKPSRSKLFHFVSSIRCLRVLYEVNIFGWGLKDYGSTLTHTNTQNAYEKPWFCLHRIWEYQTTRSASWEICMWVRKNWTWNNRLVPNKKRSTSRLYIVTLLI